MFRNVFNKFIIFLIFLLLLNLCSCKTSEIDVHIFSSIEECQGLKDDDSEVKIYEDTNDDKNLKNLEFQEFFGCKYSSDDLSFELFAYVFSNPETAMRYFVNKTGRTNNTNPTFLSSGGMSYYSRIVVSENKAYVVYCKNSDSEEVIKFINSRFSVDITDDIGKTAKTAGGSISS